MSSHDHLSTFHCIFSLDWIRVLAFHRDFNHFLAFSRDPEDVHQLADPLSTSLSFSSPRTAPMQMFYHLSLIYVSRVLPHGWTNIFKDTRINIFNFQNVQLSLMVFLSVSHIVCFCLRCNFYFVAK